MSAFLTGFQDYLKNQKCVSSNTLQSYVRDIEHFSIYLGKMKILINWLKFILSLG